MGLRALDKATEEMIEYTEKKGISTVFSNLAKGCRVGQLGTCCNRCGLGPCRENGACGANVDTIVARNWFETVLRGTACHASHALHVASVLLKVAKSETAAFKIKDVEKLKFIATKLNIDTSQSIESIAEQVASQAISDITGNKVSMSFLSYLPCSVLTGLLNAGKILKVGVIPGSVGKEILNGKHMFSMGVMADYVAFMAYAIRMGVADIVSMIICSELQDVLLGIPALICSEIGFSVLDVSKVNIVVHGHDPLLVEKIVELSKDAGYIEKAKKSGASGINIVGCCCTGNEILMRHGIHLAGSNLQQELIIATGLVEAFVVDVQCIFPNIINVSRCFHTKIVTSSEFAKIRGAVHIQFNEEHTDESVKKIMEIAIKNFKKRNNEIFHISEKQPEEVIAGFSVETCLEIFSKINSGDPLEPLISAIKKGDIYGIVLLAGCTSPKVIADINHVTIAKKLLKKNILVIATGCAAQACGRAGLLSSGASSFAGDKLKNILLLLGEKAGLGKPLPPVWHLGSCTDNGRAVVLISAIAEKMGVPIKELPIAASAAEWVAEKAIAIGMGVLSLGITTHLGITPPIFGSTEVVKLLTKKFQRLFGGKFIIEGDPVKAASRIAETIINKRKKLGI
ncbi:MAG: anaerobic carbon-monoxide dehydrogenase catalytic subunit [Patescibacteria group bacterium]|nr:anaerobic carbon-monoxide dehydrogenase catalytic subunit [Patescibacteria group bacterium]